MDSAVLPQQGGSFVSERGLWSRGESFLFRELVVMQIHRANSATYAIAAATPRHLNMT
jgi:hypothetical protein